MVKREAGGAKRLELGTDLGGEPPARAGAEEKAQPGSQWITIESAIAVDKAVQLVRRQYWAAVDQHEMKTDMQ
jgi:hypothetical protein